jgi:hypothetical protein
MKWFGYALLLLCLLLAVKTGLLAQTLPPQKVACSECEDYFGNGGWTFSQFGVVADTMPGLFKFYHIAHPDTNLRYMGADWFLVSDPNFGATTSPIDSFVHQFTQNGVETVQISARYKIPCGMVCMGGRFLDILVTGLSAPQITAAPDPGTSELLTDLHAFPNPSAQIVHVEWHTTEAAQAKGFLYNLAGQLVMRDLRFTNGKLDVDLAALPSGSYQLLMTTPKSVSRLVLRRI